MLDCGHPSVRKHLAKSLRAILKPSLRVFAEEFDKQLLQRLLDRDSPVAVQYYAIALWEGFLQLSDEKAG